MSATPRRTIPSASSSAVRDGDRGWTTTNDKTTLRVSLASAFAALTGDSQATAERTFQVTLSAQAPGVRELSEKARVVDRVWLTPLGPEGSLELDFESEGFIDVPLNVDSATGKLRELRATLASSFGPERALPPVGPPLSSQAELMLNADRAAAARVSSEHADALSELIAVRLPLTAGEQGAELRVAFAEHDPDSNGPGDLTRAPQSKPLILPPGDGTESWVALELVAPLPLDEDALPWMVVLVSRGEVAWSLASGVSNDGATLRCGSPAGPWERLPEYLTVQAQCDARLRLVGHAEKAHPLAAFAGEACAAGSPYAPYAERAELSATQKGVRNIWESDVARPGPRTAG